MAHFDSISNWRALYREALHEPDPGKMRLRIAEAQRTIRKRARELWYEAAPDTRERRQMDAAFRFLALLNTAGANK
jgi:hypothetical protein